MRGARAACVQARQAARPGFTHRRLLPQRRRDGVAWHAAGCRLVARYAKGAGTRAKSGSCHVSSIAAQGERQILNSPGGGGEQFQKSEEEKGKEGRKEGRKEGSSARQSATCARGAGATERCELFQAADAPGRAASREALFPRVCNYTSMFFMLEMHEGLGAFSPPQGAPACAPAAASAATTTWRRR